MGDFYKEKLNNLSKLYKVDFFSEVLSVAQWMN